MEKRKEKYKRTPEELIDEMRLVNYTETQRILEEKGMLEWVSEDPHYRYKAEFTDDLAQCLQAFLRKYDLDLSFFKGPDMNELFGAVDIAIEFYEDPKGIKAVE